MGPAIKSWTALAESADRNLFAVNAETVLIYVIGPLRRSDRQAARE